MAKARCEEKVSKAEIDIFIIPYDITVNIIYPNFVELP